MKEPGALDAQDFRTGDLGFKFWQLLLTTAVNVCMHGAPSATYTTIPKHMSIKY